MYEYLHGTLRRSDHVVADVNGVIPGQYREPLPLRRWHHASHIYVYQAVRTRRRPFTVSQILLKNNYSKLINVNGIGPKSALAILANPEHQG